MTRTKSGIIIALFVVTVAAIAIARFMTERAAVTKPAATPSASIVVAQSSAPAVSSSAPSARIETCSADPHEDDIEDEETPPAPLIRTIEVTNAATVTGAHGGDIAFDAGGKDGLLVGDVVAIETAKGVIPLAVTSTRENDANAKAIVDAASVTKGATVKLARRDCTEAKPSASAVTKASAGWIEVSTEPDDLDMHLAGGDGPGPFPWMLGMMIDRKERIVAGTQLVLASPKREIAKVQSVDDLGIDKVKLFALLYEQPTPGALFLERRTCTPRPSLSTIPVPLASATLVATKPFGNAKTLVTLGGPTRTGRTAQVVSPDGKVTPFTIQVVDASGATGVVALAEDAVKKGAIETETMECTPPKVPRRVKPYVSFVRRSADEANVEIGIFASTVQLGSVAHVTFEGETVDATVTRLAGSHAIVTLPNTNNRAGRMCRKALDLEIDPISCKRVR